MHTNHPQPFLNHHWRSWTIVWPAPSLTISLNHCWSLLLLVDYDSPSINHWWSYELSTLDSCWSLLAVASESPLLVIDCESVVGVDNYKPLVRFLVTIWSWTIDWLPGKSAKTDLFPGKSANTSLFPWKNRKTHLFFRENQQKNRKSAHEPLNHCVSLVRHAKLGELSATRSRHPYRSWRTWSVKKAGRGQVWGAKKCNSFSPVTGVNWR